MSFIQQEEFILAVGRRYQLRNGEVVTMKRYTAGDTYPWVAANEVYPILSYTLVGKFVANHGEHPFDIVREYVDNATEPSRIVEEAEMEATLFTCDCCGTTYRIEDAEETEANAGYDESGRNLIDGEREHVCDNCLEYEYSADRHGNMHHNENLCWVESRGEYYHRGDPSLVYSEPEDEFFDMRNCMRDPDGNWVSDEYWNEYYFECDSCGETFSNDEYAEDGQCHSCYNGSHGRDVYCYNEDPLDHLQVIPVAKTDRQYSLGVELEIENLISYSEDIAYDVQQKLEGAILKEDGSLNRGFEVVTTAAPYSWHVGDMWTEERLKGWRNLGGRSFNTDTCGLHIHVGRSWLTQLQIAKAMVFVNNPDNLWFIELVAQRDIGRWARTKNVTYAKRSWQNGEKYEAINLNKRPTIEFRIFKGTLARDGILRALQFVTTVLDHCSCSRKDSVPVAQAHMLKPYLESLCHKAKDNEELCSWLVRKNVLEGSAKTGYKVSTQFDSRHSVGSYSPIVEGRVSHEKQLEAERQAARIAREREQAERAARLAAARERFLQITAPDAVMQRVNQTRALLRQGQLIPLGQVAGRVIYVTDSSRRIEAVLTPTRSEYNEFRVTGLSGWFGWTTQMHLDSFSSGDRIPMFIRNDEEVTEFEGVMSEVADGASQMVSERFPDHFRYSTGWMPQESAAIRYDENNVLHRVMRAAVLYAKLCNLMGRDTSMYSNLHDEVVAVYNSLLLERQRDAA